MGTIYIYIYRFHCNLTRNQNVRQTQENKRRISIIFWILDFYMFICFIYYIYCWGPHCLTSFWSIHISIYIFVYYSILYPPKILAEHLGLRTPWFANTLVCEHLGLRTYLRTFGTWDTVVPHYDDVCHGVRHGFHHDFAKPFGTTQIETTSIRPFASFSVLQQCANELLRNPLRTR